jgi:hypothetical protein
MNDVATNQRQQTMAGHPKEKPIPPQPRMSLHTV